MQHLCWLITRASCWIVVEIQFPTQSMKWSFAFGMRETGGSLIWAEKYDVFAVDGRFHVILGSDGGEQVDTPATAHLDEAFEEDVRYLGLTVTTNPDGSPIASPTELSPRQQFLSAPYAINAATAVNLGDNPAADYQLKSAFPAGPFSPGQLLSWDGSQASALSVYDVSGALGIGTSERCCGCKITG